MQIRGEDSPVARVTTAACSAPNSAEKTSRSLSFGGMRPHEAVLGVRSVLFVMVCSYDFARDLLFLDSVTCDLCLSFFFKCAHSCTVVS
jgi:hypothetical protein